MVKNWRGGALKFYYEWTYYYKYYKQKTDYNAKIKDIEDKIPSVTNLATTAALTSVENKIPNVDYDAKILEMELLLIIVSSRVIHLMQR